MEIKIIEKVRLDVTSNMEIIKNEMEIEIMTISGLPINLGMEDGYEEFFNDFEVVRSSGEDRVDRLDIYVEDRVDRLDRSIS